MKNLILAFVMVLPFYAFASDEIFIGNFEDPQEQTSEPCAPTYSAAYWDYWAIMTVYCHSFCQRWNDAMDDERYSDAIYYYNLMARSCIKLFQENPQWCQRR